MHYNMTNETLIKISKEILKNLLSLCNESERKIFNKMHSPENIDASIDDIINNIESNKIDWAITQCENTLKKGNRPYIPTISIVNNYNPEFGDDKKCKCGHSYYRHFDTYEEMSPVGCKYCGCYDFKEKI